MGLLRFFKNKKRKENNRFPLYLFDTLSNDKRVFESMKPGVVRMYNCGPTVYGEQHIGNLRAYVTWDVLRRILHYNGYAVRQVINITDVGHLTGDNEGNPDIGEDKMSSGLRHEGKELTLKNMRWLGEKYTKVFIDDLEKLNIRVDKISFPRASDYIGEQIALVQALEEKGYAYKLDDGVYFDTSRFEHYGELGNIDIEKLREGVRIQANEKKRNPTDFVLWKTDETIGWDSPWGKGFPGWHLECTAMIFANLGRQIDIHTGGIDHIPVHHNNEIAQAEAATARRPFVRYWLHNAFITIEGQKIAKSIGNTIFLRNLVDRGMNPLAYRYWLLTAHYRSPVNFTWEALEGAQTALTRLHRYFIEELGEKNGTVLARYRGRFQKAVNDDLDTPKALSILWELVRDEDASERDKRATLVEFDKVLGVGLLEGSKRLKEMLRDEDKRLSITEAPDEVQKLLEERDEARRAQDWERADDLRRKIEAEGYRIEDTDEGPRLHKA